MRFAPIAVALFVAATPSFAGPPKPPQPAQGGAAWEARDERTKAHEADADFQARHDEPAQASLMKPGRQLESEPKK